MKRTFAYNPGSPIPNTDQIGSLAIGNIIQDYSSEPGSVRWWSGPSEDYGYVIAKSFPAGGLPTPIGNVGDVLFQRSSAKTDASLINLVTAMGAQGVSTIGSALSWLSTNEYWCSYNANIPVYNPIKVNPVESFLGNSSLEDQHIAYALSQGFNIFQMYGMYTVFDSPTLSNHLENFNQKLYNSGLLPVAIMGAGRDGFDLAADWEDGRTHKFWGVNKENEFWNYPAPDTETFANWIDSMQYVKTTYPHWHRSAYIANPTNNWGSSEANQMIAADIHVIEATNYNFGAPNPSWSAFLNNQLQYLANAANSASKIQCFVPLWSSESMFSGPYFASNAPLGNSVADYAESYAALSFTNKASLRNLGFSIFSYDDLINYLP